MVLELKTRVGWVGVGVKTQESVREGARRSRLKQQDALSCEPVSMASTESTAVQPKGAGAGAGAGAVTLSSERNVALLADFVALVYSSFPRRVGGGEGLRSQLLLAQGSRVLSAEGFGSTARGGRGWKAGEPMKLVAVEESWLELWSVGRRCCGPTMLWSSRCDSWCYASSQSGS